MLTLHYNTSVFIFQGNPLSLDHVLKTSFKTCLLPYGIDYNDTVPTRNGPSVPKISALVLAVEERRLDR